MTPASHSSTRVVLGWLSHRVEAGVLPAVVAAVGLMSPAASEGNPQLSRRQRALNGEPSALRTLEGQ